MKMGSQPFGYGGRASKKGFLLVDFMLTISISAILVVLFAQCVHIFVGSWQKMRDEAEFQNASTIIMNALDKSVSQEALTVKIIKDSKGLAILQCDTYLTAKFLEIVCENEMLYLKTKTLNGTGKNPIFPVGCRLKNWQVKLIDVRTILVSFTLVNEKYSRDYTQLLTVINGNAYDER